MSDQASTSTESSPSTSAPAGTSEANDLSHLFECHLCFKYVLPPIMQCQSGHLFCLGCRQKLKRCSTCRSPFRTIRSLAKEKAASTLHFPCKFAASGCDRSLTLAEKLDHENMCKCRSYSCPCPGTTCKWHGLMDAVIPHLTDQHKSIITLEGDDIVFLAADINIPGAIDWVMMQSCFGFNFMLVLEKKEKHNGYEEFIAIVQLIGSSKDAKKFTYRLELNGHRRRLSWEGVPTSINDEIPTVRNNGDCLIFDASLAQHFTENGNLSINVTIILC
ncbi:E3 ubiquitin-protein ligase SIAH1-like [Sorex araneus]|uniref:E3 ubiquitin-protein ligase SIAH1-like n=1 Tax=Sorex araneus TaxID=42254 RepID=UPI0003314F8F|nr:E3 ubiquitin-protein ligase SIAH1-like [Sorex araneus]